MRPPMSDPPKVGARVEVRTRGSRREIGVASVIEVGAQVEQIAPALLGPVKLANLELGLPISISVPAELKIMPGELVDLTILPGVD